MIELSIIVPVYNVENFLPKCLDSILNQEFSNFELILIDDGSTDRSPQICDDYASIDARILVVHQKNSGVSKARNTGLKLSKGKYIGFVDPDDYIEKNMYSSMIECAQYNNSDIVVIGVNTVFPNKNVYSNFKHFPKQLTKDEYTDKLLKREIELAVWNKIYLRNKFENIRFENALKIGEDFIFNLECCTKAEKVNIVQKIAYNYVIRNNSAFIENGIYKISEDSFSCRLKAIEIVKKIGKKQQSEAEKRFVEFCLINFKNDNKTIQKISINYFLEYFKSNYFEIMVNKKIHWKTRLILLLLSIKYRLYRKDF